MLLIRGSFREFSLWICSTCPIPDLLFAMHISTMVANMAQFFYCTAPTSTNWTVPKECQIIWQLESLRKSLLLQVREKEEQQLVPVSLARAMTERPQTVNPVGPARRPVLTAAILAAGWLWWVSCAGRLLPYNIWNINIICIPSANKYLVELVFFIAATFSACLLFCAIESFQRRK